MIKKQPKVQPFYVILRYIIEFECYSMGRIRMIVKDLKSSKIKGFDNLVLLEADGSRALNISIQSSVADSIAIIMDNICAQRPIIYDTFKQVLQDFSLQLQEIEINKFFEGSFYATASIFDGKNARKFDVRPSDAINLALRCDCPIFATKEILDEVGFDYCKFFSTKIKTEQMNTIGDIDNLSIFGVNMLQDLLKDAIEKEDYITASILRDKINEEISNSKKNTNHSEENSNE